MAKKLGTIKSISGSAEVIAVDKSGNQRVLKVGDSLYEGESVKTTSADSKVVIATNNGKELSMIGEDTLSLDPRATAGDSQVAALQKALLNGTNLEDLEETAAGGNSGGRGDGMSLGETRFEHGGHYSNINASTSAINPLGAASFAGPAEGKSGGLDSGRGGGDGFYIDTTPPRVIIDGITPVDTNNPADGNPDKGIVKGHSDEPNAPVVVKDKDGKIIGSGTTDDRGNFEVTTDPIKPGNKVTVEVTDKAGNTGKGDGTAGNTVYTDTTPPTVEDVKVTPVDENNPADGNPDKGIVKGHSDEPNAPVVVKDKDGKIIGSGTTDDKGNFEVPTDPIKPGDKVTVEVTDKAGNTGKGDGTAGNTVYTDTTPPTVEDVKVTPVDENNPADGNPDKGIVKGHSDEPNAPVVVKDKDGKIIGSGTTDDKGNFEVPTDPIKPGDKVTVEVTDKAGNTGKGDGTAGNTVYTDTTPPTVEDVKVTPVDENNPADGNPDKGIVKGHSDEPNAPVVVKDKDGKIIGSGTTDDKGNFEVPTDPIKPGDKVTVEVTDKAGNTGKGDGTAGNTVYTDTTPPSEPTITFVEDTNPKDGKLNKAENGSDSDNANTTAKISIPADAVVNDVIKYTVNGEEKSHPITEADKAKGHIEVKVPVVDGQTSTITAKIVDQAGNASKEVSGSVDVDLTIGNPKVRFLEDTDNNGVLSVAEVAAIKDGKAHWVIDIPTDGSIKAGDVIQSIDSKGNWVKFVTITDEMIKDGRFEATFNVDIEKLRNGKYETPEYRFADEAGNVSDSSKATLTLDSELTRQPSNPSIKFPEDNDPKDGKISDKENKAGDGDAGKTTAEVIIPQDGSVKPGDKLIVTDDNGKKTERPIEQSDIDKGSIDVPVELNPGKDNTIIAEIVNPNNPDNPGKGKGVIGENSEATKAPEAPVITDVIDDVEGGKFNQSVKGGLTNDSTPTIKGTVKAGSTVIIYDNGVEIGRIENANANWEFTTPALTKQGEHKFTAIAKNEFGESGSSNEATIELDTIAPVIKEVTITPIDTAAKADDTAEATLIVGVTDTPHATVIAKDKDGNFLGRADANDKGGFVIDAKPVNPGDKVVFEVTDKAGNTSESEFKAGDLAHPNDHTAPKVDIETVTPVDETKPSDGTPDKGIVKGKSDEPNAPVVVTDKNGKTIGTGTTDDKGNFEVTTDPIKPGDKVTVEVTDKAGNKGKDTETAGDTDIIHKDLPEVPVINEVIDNIKGYGEDTKVGNILDVEGHLTNDKTPTIKGTAKAGSTVVIYDNGVEIGKIENADANWEFTTSELTKQGEHKFTAIAVNKFGKSAPSNEATIDLDSIAPKLDNVKITPIDTNSRADDTAEITMGTGHTDTPNAEILFRDGDNNIIGKGHANSSGDFAIQLDKAVQPGTPVFVQAIDKAGNAGTDMAVAGNIEHPNDHTAPSEPTITFVEDTNPKDGKLNKAENGSDSDNANTTAKISIPADAVVNDVIKYTVNGEEKSHPITEADKAKGHIEVKVPVVDGQTSTITAKIVDQAGNASKEVSGSVDVDLTIGNPKVRFLEDTDNNGVLSVAEVAAIKDGKAHWVIDIPTDGSIKAGDVIQSIDSKGNWVKFVTITDEMIKDGRFEATFNVDIEKLRNGKYETPEYRFADEAGNVSDSSKATLTLDSELTRQPSNPSIKFPEDNDPKDGKISDKENKAGDGDAGKTTAEVIIPQDGSVKPGDKLIVKDNSDKPKEHVITDKDIENGKVEISVDIKTGDKTTITAEIINPNNPSKPSEEISKDITEASSTVQVTIDEIYDDVAGGVVNGDVKNGLTNDNLPTFKGSAAPGATVEIYESFLTTTEKTLVGKIVADANGKWSFTPTEAMGDGLHYFEAHATDSAGNKSITPKVELDVDATAPSVENLKVSPLDISNPADNTPEKGRVEGSSDTQDAKIVVKDEAGNVIGEGKVGGDGKFVIDTTKPLNPGDKVKVEITDEAGNTGKGSAVTGNDIIHTHATTQVTIDEIYDDVAGGVVNGDVKNGLTNDNLPTFKGSAAPGATVEIYESFLTTTEKTLVGKIVADANGKWSFTPTEAMGDGLHYFEAHATDSAGNKSITPKVELDVDATAPSVENLKVSPLDISNPADNTPEKGRVEGSSDTQDAKIVVKDEAGNVIGEGKVGGDGKFVIDTTKPLNPGDKVKVEITDEAGNTGKGSAVTGNDIIHTHATTQVTIDEIYDDVAGGVVNGDVKNGLTNDNLPTFKGSAAPGATVEIYESFLTTTEKTLVGKIVADANGKWSFTPTEAMGDGLHYFEAHATDSAGNKSITPKVELDVDATAPSVENLKVSPLDISNPADNTPEKGRVEGSSDTQDAKIVVKDEAGNVIGEGKVGGDGKFVIDTTKPLNPGDKVKVEITDEAGNTGKGSAVTGNDIIHTHATTQVTIDEIYDDVAGGVVNGDVKNGLTNDNLPTFKGSAAPGATVEIYESFLTTTEKTLVGKIVADANGKWSFTPTEAMGDGLHYFEAHATDSAGNKSITPKVELDVDATAPSVENLKVSPLDISNPADNTPEKGRVEGSSDTQDAKIVVKDEAGNVIGEGKVGGDGKFVIDTTKPLNPGDKVKVEITDEAGNTGKGSAVTGNDIIHTHATTQVTIDEIYDDVAGGVVNGDVKNGLTNDNLPTFKGSAAPGATVEIYESFLTTTEKTLVGKIVADANGKWSFTPTEAMGDGLHYFEAHATDSAGNKSITPKVELDVDATAPSVENLKVSPLDISNPADNTPEKGRVEGSSDTQDAKIVVKDEAGNVIGEGKVGGDGKFVIDTTKPLNPGDKVKVEITDEAGNTGKGSAVTGNDIIHTHATTQVTIDEIYDDVAGGVVNGDVKNGLTNDNLPTFKGSAAPGATVEIYESFLTTTEKTLVGKIVADANGKWSFTPTEAMGDGLHYFEAHATDSAGNKSITPKVELDVDATANAPVINAVNDDVDSHTGNVLDAKTKVALTNDSTPTLEGYAEPNSVVTIYEISELSGDKRAIGTTTADKYGGWKFELPQLEDGEYQYTTRIQDKAGNISDFSETVIVNVDLVAPSEPTITFVEDINKKDGKLNKAENGKDGDNASTTAQISVPGDAEENDVIHYTVNGEEKTHTITYNDRVAGYIEVKVPVIDGQASTITAKIVDQAGNSSEMVKESISSDFTAPNVQITGIIDNVPGGTYKDNVAGTSTNDNKPTIKGIADTNQEVVIYDTDKEIGRVKADKDGKWEFKPIDYKEPLADLVGRVHIIKAVVTDAAGNSSEATSALEVDTTVGTPKVKFKEDLNSNEVLSVEEAKALTDGKLHWIVEIPTDGVSVKAGDILQVYGQDGKWKNATFITKEDIAKGSVERDGFVMDLPKGNGAQSPAYRIVDIVGNESEGDFANLVYDKELTRQPSNPSIKFPEDTNEDGKISDKENKAGDKDAGKTTAEVVIPQDGSVKPGDKLVVTDENGKQTEKTIGQGDIDKGSIDVPVELNPGKDNTIIAEIVNPNNPDNPGKGKGVIGENSEATKAPEAPVITDVIDDVKGGKFNEDVKGGLTNDNTPTIKGTAKAGSTVIIYDNGVEIGRIENANANWEFTTPVLKEQGKHKFTAIAKNEFGESGSSNEATIELDTIAPSVENVKATPIDMSNPADSTPEKGRVEGSSDTPGAIVVIKDQAGKEIIGSGKVGNDGKFSIETTRPINTGDKVTVEITDKAGNTGKGEAEAGSVKHEGDSAAPCDPTITFVEDINPEDGKLNKVENSKDGDNASTKARISFLPDVVEGDVIKYTINNGKEQNHTVTADDVKAGYIEVKVPVVDGQTSTITAKIVDQANNESEAVTNSIDVDLTASDAPVITQVTDNQYGGIQDGKNVLGIDNGLTNDSTPTFKGTAEPNTTITLRNGNDIIGKNIQVDANGDWSYTPAPLAEGVYNVTAIATDKAGNDSKPSNVATITVDLHSEIPVITEIVDNVAGGVVNGDVKGGLTNDNTPTLKGTAEPFATVEIKIDGRGSYKFENGKLISNWTAVADKDGNWEFTTPKLSDGHHNFEAQATDVAGNNSQPSALVSIDVDTTAGAPKVMITADKDDNSILTATEASSITDGKLKWVIKLPEDAKEGDRIEVANSHREWVTILTLSAADIAKGEVIRDDFSADFVKGKPGFETPSYRIVDQAGNVSTEHWDTVKFDKSAPTAPVIKEVIDDVKGYEKDTKVGNVLDVKGGLTNDNMPTIKGTAEAGIKVNIYDNGKWIGDAKADANGNWNFTPSISAALPDGKHSITAVAENTLGVNSEPSNAANIDVDTVTPKPTIDSITDNVEGGVYKGDVKGGLTNDNRPVFKGSAEKGAFIELFDNGKVIGTTEAGEDGKWTIQPKEPMADGKHDMVVQATDLAGNRSRSDQSSSDVETNAGVVKITAVCDDVAGYNGKVGNILGVNNGLTNDSTPTIKGTAKPGTTITIKDGNSVIDGVIKYNGDGSWEFTPKTPFADGEHKLTAIATSRTSGAQSVSNVATIDVDTKIADAKVEFIEDTNNDGKFSWKENIENTHTGRLSWKALIPDDGSIKAGDIFHYKWDETGWHERAISQAEIDRGYIGEMKNNQIDKDQPDAGKPIPYGKNANGSVYVAEAFFSDAAGNKGAKGSDKIVFDFSDSESGAKTVNVKITSIDDNVPGWNGKTGNIITNEAAHIAGLTNDNTPTISGTTEAGAIVKVSIVNGKTHKVWEGDVKANENGEWSITTDNIADGNYSVTAVATNKAGAVSNPYTVSNLEIDATVAKPNILVAEDRNHDGFYDNAEYHNPANGKGDITFVVEVPKDGSVKVGDTFHYTLNTDYKGWSSINGYGENITISQADIDSGSFSRVVTLCKDNQHFDLRHDGATISMKGQFKDLAGNALADETSVKFDLTKVHGGKVRSTRSLPDDILDNDSVDLSNAARINEPKAELNVLNNNKIGVSANDLLETPKDHIMSEGKSEAKPSYATANSHAGEENIATTHPIQIEEKVESHF